MNIQDVKIKKAIYSNPYTHILWSDGTKTTAKCDDADTYDELTGFMMCVFKKMFPAKQMRKMFKNYVYGNDKKYIKRDKKYKLPKYKDYGNMTLGYSTNANKWALPYEYVFMANKALPAGTYITVANHGGI